MISADFYPTSATQTAGGNTYAAYTARIGSVVAPADFPPGMYWLGYVAWDDLPACYRISRITRDNGRITCREIPQNVDIGYMGYSPAQRDTTNIIVRADTGLRTIYDSSFGNNVMFFNALRASAYGRESITIVFYAYVYDLDQGQEGVAASLMSKSVTLGFRDALDFVNGASRVELTNWTVEQGANFSAADVYVGAEAAENGRRWYFDTTVNNVNVRLCVTMLSITAAAPAAVVDPNGSTVALNWSCPRPVVHFADGSTSAGDIATGITSPLYTGQSMRVKKSDLTVDVWPIINNDVVFYGFNFEFGAEDFAEDDHTIIFADDMTAVGFSFGQYFYINPVLSFDDIRHYMGLQIRWIDSTVTGAAYGYTRNKIYAPYITDDNRFTGSLITGDLSDPAYMAKLRPWQYDIDEWSENDYTDADRPPYTPGGDDDEKIGDSIGFNVNVPGGTASGLYTMYALRQAHVSNLGAALWTSFNSPDSNFWQNVRMAAGLYEEAGSFDLSTILDYIASIRIYPFALINLPGYAGAGTGAIRMGTGKIPLDLSTGGAGNVGIMGSYTGIIDAGSVTIPAHYGDFRDLEGVTMSVYLPYIGNVTLNPAEVSGQTLQATYAVDLTSGSCVAYLLLSGTWGYYPIGVYSGTIGADIPLTASQGNRMFLRDLKNVLGLGSILGGSLSGVDATDGDALAGAIGSGLASGAAYMAKNVYRQGMGAALTPPTLGGGGANFAGFGAPQTAYVQIRRHLYAYNSQTFPADQMGRRTYGVKVLGTLTGFTVCDAVDVSGIPAPADIQTDIKNALESGVYL